MKTTAALFTGAILLAVSACENAAPLSPDFGNAVYHNMSMQIINPEPVIAGPPDMNGVRAEGAMERYEKGLIIQPDALETSTLGSTN